MPAIAAAALLTTPLHADAVPNSTLEATTGVVSEGAARNPSSAAREVLHFALGWVFPSPLPSNWSV